MINFKRNEKKRIFCINVYLCVPPGNAKLRHKIKYNKSKYKLYIIEISNASDIAFIQEKGSQFQVLCKPSLWCRIEIH